MTGASADNERRGRLGAELLVRRMGGWSGKPETIVLPVRLIARGSGELSPAQVDPADPLQAWT